MYNLLDTKKTSELLLIRHGWFNSPEYELTDKVDSYGKLSYNGVSRRTATAISATNKWKFKIEKLFSHTILIADRDEVLVGKVTSNCFSRKRLLIMQTGFQAEFYAPFFSWNYVWRSADYGQIMHVKAGPINLKDTIYIDQSATPPTLIPLLIFWGSYLNTLRRESTH